MILIQQKQNIINSWIGASILAAQRSISQPTEKNGQPWKFAVLHGIGVYFRWTLMCAIKAEIVLESMRLTGFLKFAISWEVSSKITNHQSVVEWISRLSHDFWQNRWETLLASITIRLIYWFLTKWTITTIKLVCHWYAEELAEGTREDSFAFSAD